MLAQCRIADLAALTERCQTSRRALGLSPTRWAAPCLLAAIQLAVLRGWPPEQIQPVLLSLAADRETRSPMRVAEAGPWWDQPRLLTTVVAAWVILWLVPSLLGSPIGTLRQFQPDLGVLLIVTAGTGVLWAAFRLTVAYSAGSATSG